jgi:hypothetical protein
MKRILLLGAALIGVAVLPACATGPAPHHVVLVTLDGARWQEMFGGLDLDVLRSTLEPGQRAEDQPVYQRFWAGTPVERREKLMPFFWGTLMRDHGSIAGNPALDSHVRLANQHRFSYPGYSEILVGRPQDDVVKSNNAMPNPSRTVLEFVRSHFGLARDEVAVFASWEVFNALAESQAGTITINAGFEPYEHPDSQIQALSALQMRTQTPWNLVRHDAYTIRFALAHLATHQPRVLYLGLGDTDDWAHDGRYDRVLEAFRRTDDILGELWAALQASPRYRDRTSLLITTDHGRGGGADWRHHGKDYPDSADTWMAFVSPTIDKRGEWRSHPPLEARQAAATLLQWLGVDSKAFDPNAAPPVSVPK